MSQALQINTGTDDLLAEIRDRVGVITLNRPQARNAISQGMKVAWSKLIKRFADDPHVGAILIGATGTAFCAGGDVKGMRQSSATVEATFEQRVADLRADQRKLIGELFAVRKPTVAALPGAAAGAGLAIALACDIRIASQSAILTTSYAKVALSGDCGIAWLLTKLVGVSRARELMLLSERIDSRRAEELGLLNRVVTDAELPQSAFELAASLAHGPTFAFSCIKDNLDHAAASDLFESMDHEAENLIKAELTLDHQEGVQAFAEKRKPVFEGR
ncbi:enoyl-CoA hydratase-related protein [Bradyrhizobium yuanmingense]|uniref:enoyl-CoA hydratase-related protein n=1 Tax=Bradyrhizobium yuanmingense TaxID=108015 RepID=UPI0023B95017|nr:enoyl-CoA hydratase-related protein [Bradyrhizobium yuanmingense]MDF0522931.1 enoyl-CoA hydratase-related protein [Bradyrhizobium yuanmingense]